MWVTFRHVFSTIIGRRTDALIKTPEQVNLPIFHGNILEFLGAQAALLSPIIFGLLLLSFVALVRRP